MLWVCAGARQHAGGVNIETPAAVAQWFGEVVLPDAVMRTKRDALWSMPCCTLMQFPETSFLPCVTPSSPTPGQGGRRIPICSFQSLIRMIPKDIARNVGPKE